MQNKYRVILLLMTVAFFIALLCTFIMTNHKIYDNLLLIVPRENHTIGADYESLEEINETKCMLTYEVNQQKSIQAVQSGHTVTLKGTNYTYPYVMNYNILNGSFFTKDGVEQKSRFVVMNELAAFEIFGGINILGNEILLNNVSYRVVGVINDRDKDNKNVYVPISHFTDMPNTFMAKMDRQNGISSEYIQNEYKQVGVTATNYDFINLDTLSRIVREKTVVATKLIACVFLLYVMKRGGGQFVLQFQSVRELSKQYYFRSFVRNRTKNIMSLTVAGIFFGLALGILIWILLQVVETFLRWAGDPNVLGSYSASCFSNEIQLLQNTILYSNIFFVAFAVMIIFFLIALWDWPAE